MNAEQIELESIESYYRDGNLFYFITKNGTHILDYREGIDLVNKFEKEARN